MKYANRPLSKCQPRAWFLKHGMLLAQDSKINFGIRGADRVLSSTSVQILHICMLYVSKTNKRTNLTALLASSLVFLEITRNQSPIILSTAAKYAKPTKIQKSTTGL